LTLSTEPRVKNRVLLALLVLMLVSNLCLPLLTDAPNRLVSGQGIALFALLDHRTAWFLLPFWVLAILPWVPQTRPTHLLTIGSATLLLSGFSLLAGLTANRLSGDADSLVRVSFGGGFWISAGLCCLMATDAISRVTARGSLRILANLLVFVPLAVLLAGGQLDQLSILKEYANRKDVFGDALWRHLEILFLTLMPSVLLALPLGLAGFRRPRLQRTLFSVLNMIQTIPSIALFGLLIAPLAALARQLPWLAEHGVSGIGMAPAVIALVLYSLLPLVRSIVAGLEHVPPAVVEAAHGMGLTPTQVLLHVEVPLALPVFLSGLRVTAIQAVGLTVVAALIGAGGLGGIVFQGLLSSALDLVLLGVIPVVVLAVMVDSVFKFIVSSLENAHA
jgi:osmoprotectant transport system permease protein